MTASEFSAEYNKNAVVSVEIKNDTTKMNFYCALYRNLILSSNADQFLKNQCVEFSKHNSHSIVDFKIACSIVSDNLSNYSSL